MSFKKRLNSALLMFFVGVPEQINLIKQIRSVMDEVWGGMIDMTTRKHLIEGVKYSTLKTDAIKDYVEKISRLVFDSQGGWQRGFTTIQVSELHSELVTAIQSINSKTLTHDELFVKILTSVFGYDKRLVEASLESNRAPMASIVDYLRYRFDLSADSFDGTITDNPFDGFFNEELLDYIAANPDAIFDKYLGLTDTDSVKFFRTLLGCNKSK